MIRAASGDHLFFSISDLYQGGGESGSDIYQLLNLQREFFIENKIRAIFWLTQEEMQDLLAVAPDFWAFRHRVLDFISERATPERSAAFSGLTWFPWSWHLFDGDLDEALRYREETLRALAESDESLLMRADLTGEIAGLYYLFLTLYSIQGYKKMVEAENNLSVIVSPVIIRHLKAMMETSKFVSLVSEFGIW